VLPHPPVARVCVLSLAVALAYAAFTYETDLNRRRPPVLLVHAPATSHGPGPAERVVWVLVDGLRLDSSRRMPVLNRLRREGQDVIARAEFPSFSGPNFVAQASGVEPAASGVLTNGYPGEVALDSVFRRAKLAGLATAVLTTDLDYGLGDTYASWTDERHINDPELDLPAADLVFAHIGYVDTAGHAAGADSAEYRAAVARADAAIGRIAATLDPAREALVVTSDHGNLAEGGHGGTEPAAMRIPIVVWGAGAVRGTRTGRGRDVGPTIVALLGIGPLAHATGRPLVPEDAATSRQRAAARALAGTLHVDYVPLAIPMAILALLLLDGAPRLDRRLVTTSPTYAVGFAGLLVATHTVSFSVSNDPALFGARVTALGALATLVQLGVGGRTSLVPAALFAALATLWIAVLAAQQPLAPADGTLRFLPIPALTGLAFICLATALFGRREASSSWTRRSQAPRLGALPHELAVVTVPGPGARDRPGCTA
jgi:phosphopentomutase/2,3-bisphosphoglycerate-independent phosphoglycerate mutase family metalloenzyme/type I phosphodiesterase/nucleotide pyrophosphatase